MQDRRGIWADVGEGSYVRDQNEKVWRVRVIEQQNVYHLIDRDLTTVTVTKAPHLEVTIVEPTLTEAMELVGRALGGKMLATYEPGKPAQCPPLTRDLRGIHAHNFLMHGIWTASGPHSKSAERLLVQHREEHTVPAVRSHAWVNHEHR